MPIYAYESTDNTPQVIASIDKQLPGTITSYSVGNPQTVTIDTDASNKDDLDNIMSFRGFSALASEASVVLAPRRDWGIFTTANEPTVNLSEGDTGFDTTLGIFVFYTGAVWRPVVSPAVMSFGANGIAITTVTRYLFPWFYDIAAQITTPIGMRVPRDGFLRNMYLIHNVVGVSANLIVYTLRINQVATALTISAAATATGGEDTTNVVAVSAGDTIDIEVTKALAITTSPMDVVVTFELV